MRFIAIARLPFTTLALYTLATTMWVAGCWIIATVTLTFYEGTQLLGWSYAQLIHPRVIAFSLTTIFWMALIYAVALLLREIGAV
jgi:hypothetical protein